MKRKMNPIPLISLVMLLGVVLYFIGTTEKQLNVPGAKDAEDAAKLLGENRYEEALVKIDKALEQTPDNAGWHFLKGVAYYRMDNVNSAKDELKKTISYRPNDTEAYFLLGLVEYHGQSWENAKKEFENAVSVSPKHWHANYYLGRVNLELNLPAEAVKPLQIAIKHRKDSHLVIGISEEEEKMIGVYAHFYLGNAYKKLGQTEKAIEEMLIGVVGGAGAPENYELGQTYLAEGETEKGMNYIARSAAIYFKNNDKAAAEKILEEMKTISPDSQYISKVTDILNAKPDNKPKRKYSNYY